MDTDHHYHFFQMLVSKCRDTQKLYGEVYERVGKIVEDETNEQGVVVRQKITTKTITTITSSYLSRASALLLSFHILSGYLLFPLAAKKRKQRNIKHGVFGVTTGVLLGGMYFIGGRFGRDQFRIPQRVQYLQLYGRVLPASWVRY